MKDKKSGLFLLFNTLIAFAINAHTVSETTFTCPVGGQSFKQVRASSGTSYGAMLDFKPYGPIAAPSPLPVCPENGFVIYKQKFDESEIEQLKPLLQDATFQKESPYYRAYLMMKKLNAPIKEQFYVLHRATWRDGDRYRNEALSTVKIVLEDSGLSAKERINLNLLKGEFERRLGDFEQSLKTFQSLEGLKIGTEVIPPAVLSCQFELLEKKNSSASPIPNQFYKCGGFTPPSM